MPVNITVPMSQVTKSITATITVSGMRKFNVRCWLGLALIRVAAWIFPFEVEVKQ